MGKVVNLNNVLIVDQDTASEVWCALYSLADAEVLDRPISEFQELQKHARFVCLSITQKMAQQDCALSSSIANSGYLSDWQNLLQEGDVNVD
jgi:hypothetical protein